MTTTANGDKTAATTGAADAPTAAGADVPDHRNTRPLACLSPRRSRDPALRGVNLTIAAGSLIALKGRSGSGKTTLLNCLGGLDRPTKGTVRISGEEIGAWNERKLTKWRRHQVGFIFQSLGLLPALSAYENVELMLRMIGVRAKERTSPAPSKSWTWSA